jgi:hypothetical protein
MTWKAVGAPFKASFGLSGSFDFGLLYNPEDHRGRLALKRRVKSNKKTGGFSLGSPLPAFKTITTIPLSPTTG